MAEVEKTIKVKTFPSAKKERFIITKEGSDMFEIYIREPAQNNMANYRVRELIARHFKVTLQDVRIIAGHHSPKKRLVVTCESTN